MAVVIETTLGDITVDLFIDSRPQSCLNFIKLCKMKYYNFNLFHTIQSGFIAQTGDPTGEGSGGESIWGLLQGKEKRYFSGEKMPKIRHTNAGLLSMVCTGEYMVGSQFFLTLAHDLDSLDGVHCVIGEVTEGHDVLRKLNEVICDENHRPYRDVRITHTVILEDPFNDPPGLREPSRSPSPNAERLARGRIAPDEEIDETKGKSLEEIREMVAEREAKARATILEIVGDLPDAEIAPPENVLFVCKLNQVTSDEDLEIIFSRFGKIVNCEVIRDKKTEASLQYAFIEFADKKSCEDAYFKMDNVLIDDRRIHVDFSQSVSKVKYLGKGRIKHFNDNESEKFERPRKRSQSRDRRNQIDKNHIKTSNIGKNRDERYKRKKSRSNSKSRDQPLNETSYRERKHNEKSHKDKSHKERHHEISHKQKPHNEKSNKERSHKHSSHKDNHHSEKSHQEKSHNENKESQNKPKSHSLRFEEPKEKSSKTEEPKRHSPSRNNRDRSRKDSQRDASNKETSEKDTETHNYHSEMRHRNKKESNNKYQEDKQQNNNPINKTKSKKKSHREENNEDNQDNYEKNHNNKRRRITKEEGNFSLEKKYKEKSRDVSNKRKEGDIEEPKIVKKSYSNKKHKNDTENKEHRDTPDLNGSFNENVENNKKSSHEKETQNKEKNIKIIEKEKIKHKKPTDSKKKSKVVKRKRRTSSSSESSSSSTSSSSTSESSSSSESDHKRKHKRKCRKRRSPSSSSSSTSSSSSSSSESSSDSSSSSSSDNRHHKKKRRVVKKKKYYRGKKR